MTLMQALLAKQQAARDKAARRLELRRGYAQAGREREKARRVAESGLDDLPPLVAASLAELPVVQPKPAPEAIKPDVSAEELITRLAQIKERIFRLQAVFAVSLSHDAAMEANRYLILFQDLARQLQAKDADALSALTLGHESLLLSPPIQVRQTIPIETQRMCEMRWELSQAPVRNIPKRPTEGVPDGLGWML